VWTAATKCFDGSGFVKTYEAAGRRRVRRHWLELGSQPLGSLDRGHEHRGGGEFDWRMEAEWALWCSRGCGQDGPGLARSRTKRVAFAPTMKRSGLPTIETVTS